MALRPLIGLLGDSYYGFLKEDGFLYGCYEWMFRWFGYTRNGFFYAPVFLWMGAWIAYRETTNGWPDAGTTSR